MSNKPEADTRYWLLHCARQDRHNDNELWHYNIAVEGEPTEHLQVNLQAEADSSADYTTILLNIFAIDKSTYDALTQLL